MLLVMNDIIVGFENTIFEEEEQNRKKMEKEEEEEEVVVQNRTTCVIMVTVGLVVHENLIYPELLNQTRRWRNGEGEHLSILR